MAEDWCSNVIEDTVVVETKRSHSPPPNPHRFRAGDVILCVDDGIVLVVTDARENGTQKGVPIEFFGKGGSNGKPVSIMDGLKTYRKLELSDILNARATIDRLAQQVVHGEIHEEG